MLSVLLFAGCTSPSEEIPVEQVDGDPLAINPIENEPEPVESLEVSIDFPVKEEYSRALNGYIYAIGSLMGEENPVGNEFDDIDGILNLQMMGHIGLFDEEPDYELFYALKDLDGDEAYELIVGWSVYFQDNPIFYSIEDIWTVSDGIPVKIYTNELNGETMMNPSGELAQLRYTGSTYYEIYRIEGKDLSGVLIQTLIEYIFEDDAEYDLKKKVDVPAYSTTKPGGEIKQISESEFNRILQEYDFREDSSELLDWVSFFPLNG
jgi:hypothetical protein